MRSALAADIQAGAIDFALQPIFGVDGSAFGGEALARWHYNGEPVPPGVFLPLARRLGLAARLDELVLEAAVMHAVTWTEPGLLSVNVGETTLADARFADRVADLLRRSRLPAERLIVEVLEHSLLEQRPVAVQTLNRLRSIGVKIAVDDFGAGYTGLFRLHALRPDVVKLDRTLIRNTAHDDQLLDSITELAHRMNALVVAEGVEDGDQLATVRRAGCDAVQGYLLGRPRTPAQFEALTAPAEVAPAPRRFRPAR
jgi:EAL domain-containing protein (putative c-di-GMP-specific phosphodiesterase class I)